MPWLYLLSHDHNPAGFERLFIKTSPPTLLFPNCKPEWEKCPLPRGNDVPSPGKKVSHSKDKQKVDIEFYPEKFQMKKSIQNLRNLREAEKQCAVEVMVQ